MPTLGRRSLPWSLPLSYRNLSPRRSLSPELQLCFNKGWLILWPITFVVTHATKRLIKSQPSGHNLGPHRNFPAEFCVWLGKLTSLLTHELLTMASEIWVGAVIVSLTATRNFSIKIVRGPKPERRGCRRRTFRALCLQASTLSFNL